MRGHIDMVFLQRFFDFLGEQFLVTAIVAETGFLVSGPPIADRAYRHDLNFEFLRETGMSRKYFISDFFGLQQSQGAAATAEP